MIIELGEGRSTFATTESITHFSRMPAVNENENSEDIDKLILERMAAEGVDMSRPLEIEFEVFAPNEASAIQISRVLKKQGYATQIHMTEFEEDPEEEAALDEPEPDVSAEVSLDSEEGWAVAVYVNMAPGYDEIMRIQEVLTGIIAPFGGYCDGWGAILE